jgi:hypothetical protein
MEIAFYEVLRIEDKLPEIIDIDKTPLDDSYFSVSEEDAADWQKKIGQKCLIRYKAVDNYAVCEKLFGKRPSSIVFGYPFDGRTCYDQNGELIGTLTSEMLDPFRYYVEKPSYIFQQKFISGSYCWGSYNTLQKDIVTYDDLIQAAKEFMDKYGDVEYQCGFVETLLAIMKAAFFARDFGPVFCEIY